MDRNFKNKLGGLATARNQADVSSDIALEKEEKYRSAFITEANSFWHKLVATAHEISNEAHNAWINNFGNRTDIEYFLRNTGFTVDAKTRKRLGLLSEKEDDRSVTYGGWIERHILLAHFEPVGGIYIFAYPNSRNDYENGLNLNTILKTCEKCGFTTKHSFGQHMTIVELTKPDGFDDIHDEE